MGPLGTNWSVQGSLSIFNEQVVASAATPTINLALYTTGTRVSNDQSSQVTLTGVGGWQAGVVARGSTTNFTGYIFWCESPAQNWDYCVLGKWIRGDISTFTLYPHMEAVGDVLRITAQGTTISAFLNGSLVATATDSQIASGAPGFVIGGQAGQAASIGDWVGGSLRPNEPRAIHRGRH